MCVFLHPHKATHDHMECTWNLSYLNEEHSRVSKIKPGGKKNQAFTFKLSFEYLPNLY